MEEYLSFHKVLDLLQQFQESNPRLNSFGYGNLVDFGKNVSGTTVVYPFLFIVPLSIQYDQNTTTYQLTAIFADRLNEDLSNEKDCVSDMSLCARQLLSEILRGSLFNYFETTLPAQAQPFMERFNDNVAGVALDLYVQIFEDINACPQYPTVTPTMTPTGTPGASPTPTPSITPTITITPSITPTITITPSVTATMELTPTPSVTTTMTPSVTTTMTPSVTTTMSPTPSITPSSTPSAFDPQTLGALWWIDFTDLATITTIGNNITTAIDKIANVPFTATTGQGPIYNTTGYLSVSGTARSNAAPLMNAIGQYTTPMTDFTWFGFVYDDKVSQRGGKMIGASDYSGYPSGNQFFLFSDPNISDPQVWQILTRGTDNAIDTIRTDFTYASWTPIAIRVYDESTYRVMQLWQNNVILLTTNKSPNEWNALNSVFSLLWDGGIDFCTEQFFFNRKLTNTEMAQMFTYLNNKY